MQSQHGEPNWGRRSEPVQRSGGITPSNAAAGAVQRANTILDEELNVFGQYSWRIGDAFQGTQIFGGTGSGKTTGSGAAIACALLRTGFGGLVLTAKADDTFRWRSYAHRCGRTDDIIEISPTNGASFNILDHEFRQGGGLTHNVVSLLVGAMTSGSESFVGEQYWTEALREMLIHTIDLAVLGGQAEAMQSKGAPAIARPLSLATLDLIVRTAPQSPADVGTARWRRTSRCWHLLKAADEMARGGLFPTPRTLDLRKTENYWLHDFANLSPRTRSIIVSTFTSKVAGLLRWPLRELFFGEHDARYSPDHSLRATKDGRRGKIIILNLPVKTYGEVGRLAQVLYKIAWTRSADRRSGLFGPATVAANGDRTQDATLTSPAFLWADESQYFVSQEDMLFQQTARSSRVATVYLTQNIGNYAVGNSRGVGAGVYSLLGNLQTKIFHANGDPETNRFAEQTFGKQWVDIESKSTTSGDSVQDGRVSLSNSHNVNQSQSLVDIVTTRDLTMLAAGGKRFGLKVAAMVFQAGRTWTSGKGDGALPTNVFRHTFDQYLD